MELMVRERVRESDKKAVSLKERFFSDAKKAKFLLIIASI